MAKTTVTTVKKRGGGVMAAKIHWYARRSAKAAWRYLNGACTAAGAKVAACARFGKVDGIQIGQLRNGLIQPVKTRTDNRRNRWIEVYEVASQ